ncbi:MAG: Reverse transcriptase (RNA-dependent DNA polymerase) [Candidatus Moranbacteria bacterium GW2011_GWE1_36_7]|nr:MAG: Reverse transcriptase (RNA-dependent DNA polymerase) [Candidatus Moranbacteria bacterium GW2011_GWD2_36_12]KKQ07058.1 MAG: Reverse transcriptase (RNA-dependent DNA polymerase) [Candidatus Moranbacteria bacterium GW2011_GWE2_36_40]KKQ13608.1 MAG: Reverse transcriptase (RNA-dependent DNA polymerase) [Candidatus Moranbacteria bacterium GW2011_GWE1_36_7]
MYDELISLENIFQSWKEFRNGKHGRRDVQIFERFLEDNLFLLQEELENQSYQHGEYEIFHIHDPRHRIISKATVRDRIVQHLVFEKLNDIFDPHFIFHAYSSRKNKGTHLAVKNLLKCLRRESRNFTRPVFALKCDIKKFFASINQRKLLQLIACKIADEKFMRLVEEIILSFSSEDVSVVGGSYGMNFLKKNEVCQLVI